MTNLTAQEVIKRIARSLELTRKEFAKSKPSSKASRGPTRSATAKQKSRGSSVRKG